MTERVKIKLQGAQETMLITLQARVLDAQAASPLLGDPSAAQVLAKLDFDPSRFGLKPGHEVSMALRGRQLDRWTSTALAAHPDATVLHLACGLDSRVFRVAPPPSVRWFDVDLPDVIALRRQLYPERPGYDLIASSVTERPWLEQVPAADYGVVVAEGLSMYLPEAEMRSLVQRLVARFPSGELLFDAFSPFGVRVTRLHPSVRATSAVLHWGVAEPRELESWSPGLTLRAEWCVMDEPELRDRASWPSRQFLKLIRTSRAVRRIHRLLRYTWGAAR